MVFYDPRQLVIDIEVFLFSLIEDLMLLWDEGVEVHDGFDNEFFYMHAILFVLSMMLICMETCWVIM